MCFYIVIVKVEASTRDKHLQSYMYVYSYHLYIRPLSIIKIRISKTGIDACPLVGILLIVK